MRIRRIVKNLASFNQEIVEGSIMLIVRVALAHIVKDYYTYYMRRIRSNSMSVKIIVC